MLPVDEEEDGRVRELEELLEYKFDDDDDDDAKREAKRDAVDDDEDDIIIGLLDAVEEEDEETPACISCEIPVDEEEEELTGGTRRTAAGALVLLESHSKWPPYAAPITPIPAAVPTTNTAITTLANKDNCEITRGTYAPAPVPPNRAFRWFGT